MTSHKRSAKAKQQAQFEASLGEFDYSTIFAAEKQRLEHDAQQREAAFRHKSCERKNRYNSRFEAEAAISACADHGTRGLHCYKCDFCNGWHLTSKPQSSYE